MGSLESGQWWSDRVHLIHTPFLVYLLAFKESIESLRPNVSVVDHWRMTKRSVAVSVKMTPEDFNLLKKAAAHLWPGAPLTHSTLVLALAKIGAETVLRREKKP